MSHKNIIIPKDEWIPIEYDKVFKKVFGDNNYIERLNALLALIFDVSPDFFKGRTRIVNNEKILNHHDDKQEYLDIVIEVSDKNRVKERINIEVNFSKKNTKRNLLYAFGSIGNSIKTSENYNKVPNFIQINFDNYNAIENNDSPIKKCYLKDEKGNIVDDSLCVYYIDIARCRQICYNETIREYSIKMQNIIIFGALMTERKIDKFKKLIGMINMEDGIKKSITNAVDEYSSEDENWYVYDNDREIRATHAAELEDAINEGIKKGLEQGKMQEKLSTAKQMLSKNMDISLIMELTNLSEDEILKLKNN